MMKLLAASALAIAVTAPAMADLLPQPGPASPRVQTVRWQPGETVGLTALPGSALTVMLEPGERIRTFAVSESTLWQVRVTAEEDTFQIEPKPGALPAALQVVTDRRDYRFALRTDHSLLAAYLVRITYDELPPAPGIGSMAPTTTVMQDTASVPANRSRWQLGGDRAVRPQSISDDGTRIMIAFGPEQALPAVFALGATGQEEVVNGHMRGDLYVIDRIHDELVFRIDRDRASASRGKTAR